MDKVKSEAEIKLEEAGKAVLKFIKTNYLMFMFILAAVIIELTGVCVTSGKFYISRPWIYLTVIALFSFISLLLPGHKSRYIYFVSVLSILFIFDLVFIIIYDMTETIFDFAMFNLRTDAMMIIESLEINFAYVFVGALIISIYCIFGWKLIKYAPQPQVGSARRAIASALLALVVIAHVCLAYFPNSGNTSVNLTEKIHKLDSSNYSYNGITGNFLNQCYRGAFSENTEKDFKELSDFIYADTTKETAYTGLAKDYNVVTILCESFEWFTFLKSERYPFGHSADINVLKKLYNNLYRVYDDDSTIILNNSHSREKTDISENKTLIGNYPMYKFINYDYPQNSIPYSLPNLLNTLYGVESNAFHDGEHTFYNRNVYFLSGLGFKSYTTSESMKDVVYDDTGLGERNLDSQMITSCVDEMFPTDRRFMTQITTITQHGQYAERENLKEYYKILDEYGVAPKSESTSVEASYQNALRYYLAAGLEVNKAIGIVLDELEKRNLADKTLLVMYGDHNCYYQGISNYVKNVYGSYADNYTELYRTPVMIRVGNRAFTQEERVINKFTCISDIYPTMLDLLGIKTFSNLTYGHSAFTDESSIIYSRAYDKFLTDKIVFTTFSNINYLSADVGNEYLDYIEEISYELLEKISHVNRIFASDFFTDEAEKYNSGNSSPEPYKTFNERIKELNGI